MNENLDTRDALISKGIIVQIHGSKGEVFRLRVDEVQSPDSFHGTVIEMLGVVSTEGIGEEFAFNRGDVRWVERSA